MTSISAHNSAPNKALGQHWLHDASVLRSICDSAGAVADDFVFEIGPGLGTLTAVLLAIGCRVTALEFDAVLATDLPARLAAHDNGRLVVINGDVRSFDLTALEDGYKIVANIPYYLTSYLIRSLCDTPNKPSQAAILMQREVAERIVCNDGKMSMLSTFVQYYYECSLGDFVGRELFTPPPNVDSQVLVMKLRPDPLFPADERLLIRLVKAAFSEKRKTIRNALSGGLGIDKSVSEALLVSATIEPRLRAEALSWQEWQRLYRAYVDKT
jgi:16S rRNA (adenine1518-N6/adenine1519-N6)-dimethyltransferase